MDFEERVGFYIIVLLSFASLTSATFYLLDNLDEPFIVEEKIHAKKFYVKDKAGNLAKITEIEFLTIKEGDTISVPKISIYDTKNKK